jgi:diadenylate cyclase
MSLGEWFQFSEVKWWLTVLDITLVVLLMLQLYKLLRGTVAIRIFVGMACIYLFWKLLEALDMHYLGDILGQFIGVGVIALIVVFQQEIRKFLLLIATPKFYNRFKITRWVFSRFHWQHKKNDDLDIDTIVKACNNLSKENIGALLIISNDADLSFYIPSGDKIDARLSSRLLEAIFQKQSPLHDGALIIVNNLIIAASCVLPVSENADLPSSFGLRHRAAVGVTERTNALAIVVSEETGQITLCKSGKYNDHVSAQLLKNAIIAELG